VDVAKIEFRPPRAVELYLRVTGSEEEGRASSMRMRSPQELQLEIEINGDVSIVHTRQIQDPVPPDRQIQHCLQYLCRRKDGRRTNKVEAHLSDYSQGAYVMRYL